MQRLHRPRHVGGLLVVGALFGPLALTAYLLALGYRPDRLPFVLWIALAAIGGGVAIGVASGLRIAPAAAILALVALPPAPAFAGPPPGSLSAFSADAVFAAVGYGLLAGTEIVLRRPGTVRRTFTRANGRAAVLGGVGFVALLVLVRVALGLDWIRADLPFLLVATVWMLGGTFLLGATVAVAVARYRLVTPPLFLLATVVIGAYDAWRFATSPGAGVGPTLLTLTFVGWFVPLFAIGLVGTVEYLVRTRLSGASGGPGALRQ